MFAPIIIVLVLANFGQRNREQGEPAGGPAIAAYAILVLIYGGGILLGFMLQVASLLFSQQPGLFSEMMSGMGESLFESLDTLAVGIWLPSLFGIILLLKPVRRALARVIPIETDSPIDAVALSLSMLVLINLFVTLGIGLENLANLMETQSETSDAVSIVSLWVQQVMMAITAGIGVGWLVRKQWKPTLDRLGIVRPTLNQVLIGVGVGLAMVPVVGLLEGLSSLLGWQVDQDVAKLTEQLLGGLMSSPWGILTLGLAAALGEEPLLRGAAQPKFGLLLTALLFALLHSNYGITISTAVVFLLGIVLGLIRIRFNTSTAMITHAVYNISLGLIAYFSLPFMNP